MVNQELASGLIGRRNNNVWWICWTRLFISETEQSRYRLINAYCLNNQSQLVLLLTSNDASVLMLSAWMQHPYSTQQNQAKARGKFPQFAMRIWGKFSWFTWNFCRAEDWHENHCILRWEHNDAGDLAIYQCRWNYKSGLSITHLPMNQTTGSILELVPQTNSTSNPKSDLYQSCIIKEWILDCFEEPASAHKKRTMQPRLKIHRRQDTEETSLCAPKNSI